jgi:sialate O-acetylesterase
MSGGKFLALLLLASFAVSPAYGDVILERDAPYGPDVALFSDGMVLQRELPVPIFGRADAGEQVTVTFNGQQKMTTTAGDGTWRVDLDPMTAGGPFTMTIVGNNAIVINDVRVGEVWIASGQSNMTLHRVKRDVLEANPAIRTLRSRDWNDKPGIVPYTFAERLQQALGVPVGILNLATGGTNVLMWLGDTAASDPDPEVPPYLTYDAGYYYKKLVKPLQPFRFRGVIWWQGEADYKRPQRHRTLFPAAIRSWRNEWGFGDFPWISVQTPTGRGLKVGQAPDALPANPSAEDSSAFMRHTYLRSLEQFPKTSVVTSLDLEGGIHPIDPEAYAERLADHALALVYGESLPYSGPLYASMSIEGSSIRIHYRAGTANGLIAQGGPLQGFAISGDGVNWFWANATIDGDEVVLSSASVPSPIAARYAWWGRPTWANLFNGAGLTAAPFATDVTPGEF